MTIGSGHHSRQVLCGCAVHAAYYKPEFPRHDAQREHREWNKNLANAVDHVIADQDGVTQCFNLLLDSLRDFADNADGGRDGGKAHLARLFFRYVHTKRGAAWFATVAMPVPLAVPAGDGGLTVR